MERVCFIMPTGSYECMAILERRMKRTTWLENQLRVAVYEKELIEADMNDMSVAKANESIDSLLLRALQKVQGRHLTEEQLNIVRTLLCYREIK